MTALAAEGMAGTTLEGWRRGESLQLLRTREWLVTNGLGGYASGTIAGECTRRYHGKLIAALPAPLGRVVMLNHLEETLHLSDGTTIGLGGHEIEEGAEASDTAALESFHLDHGLPVWTYSSDHFRLEKRLVMPHGQNTTVILYRVIEAPGSIRLTLRPSIDFRPHEHSVSAGGASNAEMLETNMGWEIHAAATIPPLRVRVGNGARLERAAQVRHLRYEIESRRGYHDEGTLASPGEIHIDLEAGAATGVVASVEPWETIAAMTPNEILGCELERRRRLLRLAGAEGGPIAHLVLAADQFVITPHVRTGDEARARAKGEYASTIIAGYHWFTDWGRDTMISLEGLTLSTGRVREAGAVLRMFAEHVRDGLIPNMFPEGENEGLYHTADATLWFFHALERYRRRSGDLKTLETLLPTMENIIEHHLRGTRFGIGLDQDDALLRQGAEGYQLTWMDAKVEDWVVTPRRGKAVEINALFYNALRLLESWLRETGRDDRADELGSLADRTRESFNRRFWYAEREYLYDVVDGEDGDDPALRPNQIFAVALDHPVLDQSRWASVVKAVGDHLLTPVGLRSLAAGHPDYKANYEGDLRSRDAAYHQGTVWSWLIGPFFDGWMRVHPEKTREAEQLLAGLVEHLGDACIGSVSEIFDAEPPFIPRGCVAQAWGVAEMLRCFERLHKGAAF